MQRQSLEAPNARQSASNTQTHVPLLHPFQLLDSLIQLLGIFKRPPNLPRHIPKRLFKPLVRVFICTFHLRDISHLPDEDRLDPSLVLPTYIPIRFRIGLRAITKAQHFPLRQPSVNVLYAGPFVGFGSLRE